MKKTDFVSNWKILMHNNKQQITATLKKKVLNVALNAEKTENVF